jgi:hypothetical protein
MKLTYAIAAIGLYAASCATTSGARCEGPQTMYSNNPYPVNEPCYKTFENNRDEKKAVFEHSSDATEELDRVMGQ